MATEKDLRNKDASLFRAVEFAARAHAGQYRKGTNIPYLVHPLGVMKLLLEHGASEELAIAGVLHDTLEDTGTSPEDIRQSFGDRAAELVQAVSEPEKNKPWEERKEHTVYSLKRIPYDMLMLSCADKLDNIRAILQDYQKVGETLWQRFNRPRDQQEWYYRSLAEAFMSRDRNNPLFQDFDETVKKVFGLREGPSASVLRKSPKTRGA